MNVSLENCSRYKVNNIRQLYQNKRIFGSNFRKGILKSKNSHEIPSPQDCFLHQKAKFMHLFKICLIKQSPVVFRVSRVPIHDHTNSWD